MNVAIDPGRYVIAVSGGVDSVALLHMLARKYPQSSKALQVKHGRRLVVAHYNHGIRHDAGVDKLLVQRLAQQHNLPFVYDEGDLSSDASEAAARVARYSFLKSVLRASHSHAIITAHHADDALETALFNLFRGTGRKGLSALHHNPIVLRPLLHIPKKELITYAKNHNLEWREDSTNLDEGYTRNYLRHSVVPKFQPHHIDSFHHYIENAKQLNASIDAHIVNFLHLQPAVHQLDRDAFTSLPHKVAKEVLAQWLRINAIRSFDKAAIERLTVAVKTARHHTLHEVTNNSFLLMQPDNIVVIERKI